MSKIEIITDGGRRRRWAAADKLRIVEETLYDGESISAVARRNGAAPNLLYRWRKRMLEVGSGAVTGDDSVIPFDQYGYSADLALPNRLPGNGRVPPHQALHQALRPAGQFDPQGKHHADPRIALRPAPRTEPDADIVSLTLREPCPCCGGPMRII